MSNIDLNELIKTARRYNNKKRSYLLVNTLQAKHIPVRPEKALELFNGLGNKIRNNYPDAHLVIGFAETATAIGVQTAICLGENAVYINTTREDYIPEKYCICFREEHSHAVNQKLYVKDFTEYLKNTAEIVLIDDEISTGNTLFNIIQAMRTEIPELADRKFVVGSIINRLTAERVEFFRNNNIFFESLFNVNWTDDMLEKDFNNLNAPCIVSDVTEYQNFPEIYRLDFKNTRTLVNINNYIENCKNISETVMKNVNFSKYNKVLFLGTEECMFPSVFTAKFIEDNFNIQAFCHSTTRSPIYTCNEDNYPIQNGFQIKSLYDYDRINYIYNLRKYDAAVIISDAENPSENALYTLDHVLAKYDIKQRFYFLGD